MTQEKLSFEQVARESGLERLVAQDPKPLWDRLQAFCAEYTARMRDHEATGLPTSLELPDLLATYERDPTQVKALFQAAGFACSGTMLVMVWLVMSGAELTEISYQYQRRQSSRMSAVVRLPRTAAILRFDSDVHWDAAVFRFAGLSTSNDQPLIEGFYPMRLG